MDNKEKIKKLYLNGNSGIKISELLNIKLGTVYYHLKKMNITRTNKTNSVKFRVNHDSFSCINTEERAYWLGFMYADGYIILSKNGQKSIGISLSSKDKDHLYKFKSFLNSEHPVNDYVNNCGDKYSRLLITSDRMFDDLSKLGCTESKTFTIEYPCDLVPLRLMNHFIRGYFDGDGSISLIKKDVQYKLKICGTKDLLSGILSYVNKVNSKLGRKKNYLKDNWYISIGGNLQVLKILNIIYKNASVFLDRKYRRYSDLKSLYPEMDIE